MAYWVLFYPSLHINLDSMQISTIKAERVEFLQKKVLPCSPVCENVQTSV